MKPANIGSLATNLWLLGTALSLAACGGTVETQGQGGAGGGGGATTTSSGTGTMIGGSGGQSTGGAGGSSTTTTTPTPDPFACGDLTCDGATQFCQESNGGPCCAPPAYECKDIPEACQSDALLCDCLAANCPCSGGCGGGSGIGTFCEALEGGGVLFTCAYP